MQLSEKTVLIADKEIKLTNLEKIFWPEGLTKAHLVKYYTDIAPILLPYIYNRPLVMKRYPDGIAGESFYQKECPAYAPPWVQTYSFTHSGKIVRYIICNHLATLVWLANQACIEVHAFLSNIDKINYPDIAVFDLDPAEGAGFIQVLNVALLIRQILASFNLRAFVKTSGARGLHLFIPLVPVYSFETVALFARYVALKVVQGYPSMATVERKVENRKGRVYIDYLQNGRGKTMAFPYSLRPLPGAPVSMPLAWDEVEQMNIEPASFHVQNVFQRLNQFGDLFKNLLISPQMLNNFIDKIFEKKSSRPAGKSLHIPECP